MTDIDAERYFADGTSEEIEVPPLGYPVTGDPKDDAERERQFVERNRRVYAELRERRLLPPAGMNLSSQDINEFLLSGRSLRAADRE